MLGAIPRADLGMVMTFGETPDVKSATSAESVQPCFVTTRPSLTVTNGNVPVVVDLLFTNVGVLNVAAALAGTDSARVPFSAATVAAESAIDPVNVASAVAVGVGVAVAASVVAAAVNAPVEGVTVMLR
jgi:hypothetical protein